MYIVLMNYVIKSIEVVKIYYTFFYILPAISVNRLRCRIGHNECPLLTIPRA